MGSRGKKWRGRIALTCLVMATAVAAAVPAVAGPTSPSITTFEVEGACVKDGPGMVVYVETVSFEPPTSFGWWVDGELTELPVEFLVGDRDEHGQYVAAAYFVDHADPGTYEVQVSVGLEIDGIDYGTTFSDLLEVTVPACDDEELCPAGDRRYGKRILDCLGMPYGQVIRDRAQQGGPDAEGARLFWVGLSG